MIPIIKVVFSVFKFQFVNETIYSTNSKYVGAQTRSPN